MPDRGFNSVPGAERDVGRDDAPGRDDDARRQRRPCADDCLRMDHDGQYGPVDQRAHRRRAGAWETRARSGSPRSVPARSLPSSVGPETAARPRDPSRPWQLQPPPWTSQPTTATRSASSRAWPPSPTIQVRSDAASCGRSATSTKGLRPGSPGDRTSHDGRRSGRRRARRRTDSGSRARDSPELRARAPAGSPRRWRRVEGDGDHVGTTLTSGLTLARCRRPVPTGWPPRGSRCCCCPTTTSAAAITLRVVDTETRNQPERGMLAAAAVAAAPGCDPAPGVQSGMGDHDRIR